MMDSTNGEEEGAINLSTASCNEKTPNSSPSMPNGEVSVAVSKENAESASSQLYQQVRK